MFSDNTNIIQHEVVHRPSSSPEVILNLLGESIPIVTMSEEGQVDYHSSAADEIISPMLKDDPDLLRHLLSNRMSLTAKDGRIFQPYIRNIDQNLDENLLFLIDITSARIDPLTQVNNRMALVEAVTRHETSRDRVAILFADMDKFKSINDHYGHSVGDEVLQTTAKFLKEHVRSTDLVSRFGGDEFVLLLLNLSPEQLEQKLAKLSTDLNVINQERRNQGLPEIKFSIHSEISEPNPNFQPRDLKAIIDKTDKQMMAKKQEVLIDGAGI